MTTDLDELARMAWVQLWQVMIVALVIGTVVRLCCRDRPSLAYALWMLVVVKSIVPPVLSSPTGLFSWALADRAVAPSAGTGNSVGMLRVPPTTTPLGQDPTPVANRLEGGSPGSRGTDWDHFHRAMFSIWAMGLALCTTFVLGKQVGCSKLIRKSSRPVDKQYVRALAELSGRLDVRRRVRLIVTSRPIGPAVFGLFRPSILLPEPLLSGTPLEQVKLVLAHELIHVRRGDIFAGKLQLVAQLIWWFNPLIWWANREACRERERCCDEEVVSGTGCKPAIYARTLLSVLEQKGRLRSLVAIPGVRALEVTSLRLESIMKYTKNDHRRASSISRLVFAAGLVLLVPGTGLTLRAHPPANDNPNVAIAGVAQETTTTGAEATQEEAVRAKATGTAVDSGPNGQSELSRAEDRLRWAEEMFRKGYVSKAQLDREREKVQQVKAEAPKRGALRVAKLKHAGDWNIAPQAVPNLKAEHQQVKAKEKKSELQRAEDRLDWAERMFQKGYVSKAQLDREREKVQQIKGQQTKAVIAVAAAKVTATLKGVVREKGTGRPVAGARVNVSAVTDDVGRDTSSALTDEAGRYTVTDLPKSREYNLIASPKSGEPFFITSRKVETTKDESPITADVELVRGIPFRVRVLDQQTGKPLKGNLSYFPISPNNPFERGVMGYVATVGRSGSVCGAFYEAAPDDQGQFLGAVLAGPGFLGFSHSYRPGDESRADRKPVLSFPDGRKNIKLDPNDHGGPFAFVPISAEPIRWTGLPLGQYDAVIAIDPREGAEVVTYEIRIAPAKVSK